MISRSIHQAVICTLAVLCWGMAAYAQTAPIRIGVSLGLTGKYAPMAQMQARAYRLWEAHTNESGGILKRRVQVKIYDDQSDKAKAEQLYLQMIEKEQLDLLFAPYSSPLTMAVLPIVEKYGYPILTPGAAADSLWTQGNRYVFGVYLTASRYSLGFLELLLTNGYDKLMVVSADDTFSVSVADGIHKWAQRLGMHIVLHKTITKGMGRLESVAQAARESGGHALLMCGHFNEAVQMRKAMNNIGWYPKAYWASVGPVFHAYHDRLGAMADGSFSSTQWKYYEKLPYPGSKAFYKSFIAHYRTEPSYHAAAAYAAGLILRSAIVKAGRVDRERIRDILGSMDTTTLLGRYGVDRTGMQTKHFALVIQWIDGEQQVVWPQELRTMEPQFP